MPATPLNDKFSRHLFYSPSTLPGTMSDSQLFNQYSRIRNSEARLGSGNEQKEMVKG